jgi:hypothetical protein
MEEVMEKMEFQTGEGKHMLDATVLFCGADLALIIGGGSKPHIGACALAVPRPSLDNKAGGVSSSASVICVSGHKEDQLAREAAVELAAAYNCVVAVSIGMHVDNATIEDISQLSDNFEVLLSSIKHALNHPGVPRQVGQ